MFIRVRTVLLNFVCSVPVVIVSVKYVVDPAKKAC